MIHCSVAIPNISYFTGIAGLRTESDQSNIEIISNLEIQRPLSPIGHVDSVTPITPSNTPQSPTSGRESPHDEDLQATVERISSLRLETEESDRIQNLRTNRNGPETQYLQVRNNRDRNRNDSVAD